MARLPRTGGQRRGTRHDPGVRQLSVRSPAWQENWQNIVHLAAGEPVELALSWAESDWPLTRLPWEMLRYGNTYLAALPQPQSLSRDCSGEPLRAAGPASDTPDPVRHRRQPVGWPDPGRRRIYRTSAAPSRPDIKARLRPHHRSRPRRHPEAAAGRDEEIRPLDRSFHLSWGLAPGWAGFEGYLEMMSDEEEARSTEPRTAEQFVSMLTHDRPRRRPSSC